MNIFKKMESLLDKDPDDNLYFTIILQCYSILKENNAPGTDIFIEKL